MDISLEPYELGLEDTIQYNITNHGLIRTDDVSLHLPTAEIGNIGSLYRSSDIHLVPVKVTRRVEGREKRVAVTGSCASALLHV